VALTCTLICGVPRLAEFTLSERSESNGLGMTVVEKLVSMRSLEIAQRFNAGSRLRESPKSLQGRQTRGCLLTFLSSLSASRTDSSRGEKGLRHFDPLIVPALKRWAIFGSTDGRERDSLRLAS
jgi:hypothetical protein